MLNKWCEQLSRTKICPVPQKIVASLFLIYSKVEKGMADKPILYPKGHATLHLQNITYDFVYLSTKHLENKQSERYFKSKLYYF